CTPTLLFTVLVFSGPRPTLAHPLSLHDALPIFGGAPSCVRAPSLTRPWTRTGRPVVSSAPVRHPGPLRLDRWTGDRSAVPGTVALVGRVARLPKNRPDRLRTTRPRHTPWCGPHPPIGRDPCRTTAPSPTSASIPTSWPRWPTAGSRTPSPSSR